MHSRFPAKNPNTKSPRQLQRICFVGLFLLGLLNFGFMQAKASSHLNLSKMHEAPSLSFTQPEARSHLNCGFMQPKIRTYQAPKDAPARSTETKPSQAKIRWRAPAHWQSLPAKAPRYGAWSVPEAAITITAFVFPGQAGGTLGNIKRWAAQIQAPELTAAELKAKSSQIPTQSGTAALSVQLKGKSESIAGAIVQHKGQSWFFKMRGPTESVAREQAHFEAFIRSLSFPK